MEFFRDTKFDFMRVRAGFIAVSVIAFVASLVALFALGQLNIGIDFAGGTQLTVRFETDPDIDRVRELLAEAGIEEAQIQRFGETEVHELMIKTPLAEDSEEGSRDRVVAALAAELDSDLGAKLDLNASGRDALAALLYERDPEGRVADDAEAAQAHYDEVAHVVMRERQKDGLLTDWSQLDGVELVTPEIRSLLENEAALGAFAVVGAENVGPQIGGELRTKGILAVLFSLVGMLAYIWFRFELRFGVGALVALVHDVGITLGAFALINYEFNLTTVAAFLTVVGYSVNDTVVVFDRVRENLRRNRREPMAAVLNTSLNQTLSRTVLTSGTTLIAVTTLYLFGGDVIRGFAFVLMIGILVGTYSSIFIASPTVLAWERFMGERRRRAAA